jgi:hypothetical protein
MQIAFKNVRNIVFGNEVVKLPLNSVLSALVHWVEGGGKEESAKGILLVCARKFQLIHYPICYVYFI